MGWAEANFFPPQTVMVLKYLIKDYPIQTLYFGIANVVANGLVMLRYVGFVLGEGLLIMI
jgi:hypothetical protein